MAARKPAIQLGTGRPQGIVDDIVIPIAKKVIRKVNKKTPAKGMYKEVDMITKRHTKLTNQRHAAEVYGKKKTSERINKKIIKNMQSGGKTASTYKKGTTELGLPSVNARPRKPSPLQSQSITARMNRLEQEILAKKGRLTGADIQRLGKIEANLRNTKIRKK